MLNGLPRKANAVCFEMLEPVLTSVVTCPQCGAHHTETMPTDACVYFYECTSCGAMLKPKAGNCCL